MAGDIAFSSYATADSGSKARSWSPAQVAALSERDIASLSFDEMISAIQVAPVPVPQLESLANLDGESLVRLVYLARHSCRTRAAAAHLPSKSPPNP